MPKALSTLTFGWTTWPLQMFNRDPVTWASGSMGLMHNSEVRFFWLFGSHLESTKYLRVSLFCLWPISSWVVQRRNLSRRRVTTMCRTVLACLVLGCRYENNDIFPKMRHGELRSVRATCWLAGCSSALARYNDVAGVSQSDWPLRVY